MRPLLGQLRPRPARARQARGIISCALAHRANKIAYAMVRDQAPFGPTWLAGRMLPGRRAGSEAVIAMTDLRVTSLLALRPVFRHEQSSNDAR